MNLRDEAVEWIPLFPAKEIPFILAAVLRCSANLRKRSTTERETKISNRLRRLLIQDTGTAEARASPSGPRDIRL